MLVETHVSSPIFGTGFRTILPLDFGPLPSDPLLDLLRPSIILDTQIVRNACVRERVRMRVGSGRSVSRIPIALAATWHDNESGYYDLAICMQSIDG